jgi:hypothetical protein
VTQTFNRLPTGYSVATTPFGTNASVTNANTVVVQGLTAPIVTIMGTNIVGFQIVERPYDQGTPTSYSLQRATGAGSFTQVATPSAGALSFTDSSVSAGTTYQYRIAAVNSYGTSVYSNVVSVTTPAASSSGPSSSTFATWQSQYFTAAQLADSTVSGPSADPYGSGIPNLMAYALQLNPATAKSTDVPTPVVANGHLQITYFVPSAITDINYIVEVSSDLSTWNSGSGYTQTISSVQGSSGTTYTVQEMLPTTTSEHFMRLRVTQQ